MRFLGVALRLTILGIVYVVLIEPSLLGYMGTHVLRTAVLIWILLVVSQVFASNVPRSSKLSDTSKNVLVAAYSVFALLLVLEAVFVFVPRSHGVGYTYAAQNWFDYFWRTNSLGYRDKEIRSIDSEKPRIFVVGDSFTAGHGIRNASDTFPAQLQKLVGGGFEVLNLGRNGVDTRDEFRNLLAYPLKPSILVLQYFGNDIEDAASEAGLSFDGFEPYAGLSRPVRLLLQGSYLLNYIYWRFPHADGTSYIDFLEKGYRDPRAIDIHFADLGRFVEYSRDCDIPLVVVVFPRLAEIEQSKIFVSPVIDYFDARGVPTVDVAKLVADVPLEDRIINANDGHPSVLIHERVAEALSAKLLELGWLDRTYLQATTSGACIDGR